MKKLSGVELKGRLAWLARSRGTSRGDARMREVERLARIFIEEGRPVALAVEYAESLAFAAYAEADPPERLRTSIRSFRDL